MISASSEDINDNLVERFYMSLKALMGKKIAFSEELARTNGRKVLFEHLGLREYVDNLQVCQASFICLFFLISLCGVEQRKWAAVCSIMLPLFSRIITSVICKGYEGVIGIRQAVLPYMLVWSNKVRSSRTIFVRGLSFCLFERISSATGK